MRQLTGKQQAVTSAGEDVQNLEPYTLPMGIKGQSHLGNSWQVLKILDIRLPYDSAVPLWCVRPRELNQNLNTNVSSSIIRNSQKSGSDSKVHQRMNGWMKCGLSVQWSIAEQERRYGRTTPTTSLERTVLRDKKPVAKDVTWRDFACVEYGDRQIQAWMTACGGWGWAGIGTPPTTHMGSLVGGWDGSGFAELWMNENHWTASFKWVRFLECDLDLDEVLRYVRRRPAADTW